MGGVQASGQTQKQGHGQHGGHGRAETEGRFGMFFHGVSSFGSVWEIRIRHPRGMDFR